ncbi:hypothetical protein RRG08_057371 [Elysia crispata]|uniref:Uncharacterized protein n=1 Tax=Elysia crispata TaxID=231223 RepID=A0AAE0YJ48_9GAST|nr:hypothetical protein RRG08_057371 [Elysia crispata]
MSSRGHLEIDEMISPPTEGMSKRRDFAPLCYKVVDIPPKGKPVFARSAKDSYLYFPSKRRVLCATRKTGLPSGDVDHWEISRPQEVVLKNVVLKTLF